MCFRHAGVVSEIAKLRTGASEISKRGGVRGERWSSCHMTMLETEALTVMSITAATRRNSTTCCWQAESNRTRFYCEVSQDVRWHWVMSSSCCSLSPSLSFSPPLSPLSLAPSVTRSLSLYISPSLSLCLTPALPLSPPLSLCLPLSLCSAPVCRHLPVQHRPVQMSSGPTGSRVRRRFSSDLGSSFHSAQVLNCPKAEVELAQARLQCLTR